MKVMNIFLLAKMCCLVVMISWGQGVRAQAEESMQTDTVTQSQTQQQRPRVFVMGQINSKIGRASCRERV